ncbi:MAG: carboxy terminal-processing peptidase [Bacteroidetes bacterium]|jgi:carboxyl-terminal processing protease|nr:carboxy terminal-processing peptidase [Bacteroidota bacterium]
MTYVKQNKWKFFATLILVGGLFFAFNTFNATNPESSEVRHRKLLSTVGRLLESEHYSPKVIDDKFSKEVFDAYLKTLDPEKNILLQTDIDSLKVFATTIDDEIHGATIQFEPAANSMYERRAIEVKKIFESIIQNPFDFTTDDSLKMDFDNMGYPKNEAERIQRWNLSIKYKVLDRFVTLIEDRTKHAAAKAIADTSKIKDTVKDNFVIKSDAALEIEARATVKKSYVKRFSLLEKSFDKEKRFESFLNTITGLMDPHTDYFAPVEKRSFTEQMSGTFYGIGAQLTQDDNGVKIASIQPGGAAWKSGQLVVNDVIVKIAQGAEEPVDVSGYETTDAVKLIRGDLGTEVRLTVRKPDGTTKIVSLIREKIVLDEGFARSAIIQNGNEKYGYILLPDFYADFEREDGARCSKDIAKEVEKLKAEKVKGIIIDIRYNGGGSLYEVVQMAGLFIDKGPIVQIRSKEGKSQVLSDETPGILYDGPLVVMVNEFSASASEIFAGAIQDYKRGLIVGSTSSYGKGTVQRNVSFGKPLDAMGIQTEYGAVKLTFQKFYRVTGSSTQRKGVVPDVVFPDDYEFLKYREKDNPSALPWDEMERAKYTPWTTSNEIASIAAKANNKIKNDTATIRFKKNLQWVSGQVDKPVALELNKYIQYKKEIQGVIQQNENILKLKKPMTVTALKADYDKFYNNPDKTKQDRYQAWLKMVAKDIQVNESSKLLNEFTRPNSIAKKG